MAQRLLDGEGRHGGSLTVRDGATAPRWRGTARGGARRLLDGKGRRERGGDGLKAQRQWAAMDSVMVNGR